MLRLLFLIALVLMTTGVGVGQTFALADRTQVGGCGTARPDVLGELSRESTVPVFISLQRPAGRLAGQASLDDVRSNTAARQTAVLDVLDPDDFTLAHRYSAVSALAGYITSAGVAKLECHPDVKAVDREIQATVALEQSLPLIGADDPEFAGLGFDGSSVTVAVLDTGVDVDHPDLNVAGEWCYLDPANPDPSFCSYPYDPAHPADDSYGHGTAVSGVISSTGTSGVAPPGVAPGAGIYAFKVSYAETGYVSSWIATQAVDFIVNNPSLPGASGIDFINMSIGGGEYYSDNCDDEHPALSDALAFLRSNRDVLAFGASGNGAVKNAMTWPGCYSSVASVGAVYDSNLGAEAWQPCTDLSTQADQVTCFSDSSNLLDLLAPGAEITTTDLLPAGVGTWSGTSFSAPHAVGVAALLKQMLPNITPDDIVDVLQQTGHSVTDAANGITTPRVDAPAAVLEHDYDGDGCTNEAEVQTAPGSETTGGRRDPANQWDFYDVPGLLGEPPDSFVDLSNDILGVIVHYAPTGSPPNYDVAFDRGGVEGPNPWNITAPDGVIDLSNDILGVIQQWNHDCR